jgi:LEA14-like dessication related protein
MQLVFPMAALLVVGATGCATTEPLTAPEVTLTGVELVEATLFESTLDIEVRFSNDNPEPLVLDGAVIRLELDGRSFGKAMTSDLIEVPRLGSVVHRLELNLSHVAVATKIRSVLDRRIVDYAITGKVYAVTSSGRIRALPIDKRGSIDLRGGGPVVDASPVE